MKILKSSRIPTDAQSFPLPVPSPGYRVSGKEVEVRDSGSQHHQLCGCCDLQLIQSHVAPSHGPPATVLSPLFFLAKPLLLPKPRGKRGATWQKGSHVAPTSSAKAAWSSLAWLPRLGLNPCTNLPLQPISDSSYSQLHLPASPYSSSFTGLP